MTAQKKITVTDTILRDAHQSLLATRMRTEDMLPICDKLDRVGYWSLEVWGGATFDACVRFLKEDPWERLRQLKAALPNTRLQMLLRGQNLLGYRHYADDVVEAFCAKRSKSSNSPPFAVLVRTSARVVCPGGNSSASIGRSSFKATAAGSAGLAAGPVTEGLGVLGGSLKSALM